MDEFEVDYYFGTSWGINLGHRVLPVHEASKCEGQTCVVHNPSDHRMRTWKIGFRADRFGLVERFCPKHGIGHPDPDSVAYLELVGLDGMGVHGCCGCCRGEEEP